MDNDETIPADVVVMGVGVVPDTQFLSTSSVRLDERGFVPVNEVAIYMMIAFDDICIKDVTISFLGFFLIVYWFIHVHVHNSMNFIYKL